MFSHSHHIAMSIVEKVLLWDGHFRGSIASSSFTRSSCAWSNIASEAISEHLISNMLLVEHASRPPYRLHALTSHTSLNYAASGSVILPIHCINTTDIHGFLWLGIICTDNEEWEGHCKCACTVWRNEDIWLYWHADTHKPLSGAV